MGGWQILLELGLIGLLAATLFHALRLERALSVVRRTGPGRARSHAARVQ